MGMPAIGVSDADALAVAAYVRSVIETIKGQGAPPSAGKPVPSIVIGNAEEGKVYFSLKCAGCHTGDKDLGKIGSRIPDAKRLQNAWLAGGTRGEAPEADDAAISARTVTATVRLSAGETMQGRLIRIDVALADGTQKTFRRNGETPAVVIHDPLQIHRDLLSQYTDKDVHDVTAYLTTLQ
jgi:cytochrome c oxidase cbb3-type subunit 3